MPHTVETDTIEQRLASINRELATLSNGLEPRATARRILKLLSERDRLLDVWPRTCLVCGDSFNAIRVDARYCGDRCRQRARRQIVTDHVTASSEIRSRCGVSRPDGRTLGSSATAAASGQQRGRERARVRAYQQRRL